MTRAEERSKEPSVAQLGLALVSLLWNRNPKGHFNPGPMTSGLKGLSPSLCPPTGPPLREAIKGAWAAVQVGDEDNLGWGRQRGCKEGALAMNHYLRAWLTRYADRGG